MHAEIFFASDSLSNGIVALPNIWWPYFQAHIPTQGTQTTHIFTLILKDNTLKVLHNHMRKLSLK